VGRFPLIAGAQSGYGPIATLTDALKRAAIGSGNGLGLRAGSVQSTVDANGNQTTVLTNCAFAEDIVSGSVVWRADKSLIADLIVARERSRDTL
jgi:hypothetical protein